MSNRSKERIETGRRTERKTERRKSTAIVRRKTRRRRRRLTETGRRAGTG